MIKTIKECCLGRGEVHQLLVLVGAIAILASLSGCGGSSNRVGISLEVAETTVEERDDAAVEVILTLDEPATRDVGVSLLTEGTATVGLDYDLDPRDVVIPAGSRKATTNVIPIRDWIEDGDEVVTLAIGLINGPAFADRPNSASITISDLPFPSLDKRELSADLRVFADVVPRSGWVGIEASIYNLGAATSSRSLLSLGIGTDISNVWDSAVYFKQEYVPSLGPFEGARLNFVALLSRFELDTSYYGMVSLERTDEEITRRSAIGRDFIGFTVNSSGTVQTRCEESIEVEVAGEADPFFNEQWNLNNTGQTAFASQSGVENADLSMSSVLQTGPYGDGVNVAIVDTGLELCHPDLASNVSKGASYNFASEQSRPDAWHDAIGTDPYLIVPLGDHGTSVAGIVAAASDNGIGGRGVAPRAKLRGFNYLSQQTQSAAPSLGLSDEQPNSSDVDVFNMSYGGGWAASNPSTLMTGILAHGTTQLRNEKGAIYVKAAGNAFYGCVNFEHEMHSDIGCRSSNLDSTNNLPYLIIAGGLNAADEKASYASVGSNIWVTAPAGEFGRNSPATITTDQVGTTRGYDQLSRRGLALERDLNRYGNYISTFNGTSASTPNITGAVAVLLSENPDLTWRDVKHILASTARRVERDSSRHRIAFGSAPYVFQLPWVQNAAGYWFHNWYGFGAVDLDRAVEMARSFSPDSLGTFIETDWVESSAAGSIPDFDGAGLESSLAIAGHSNDDDIEAVQIRITVDHEFLPDLGISLRSPSGTESILNPAFNEGLVNNSGFELEWTLLSNAFYGENPNGIWVLNVVDVSPAATGSLQEWSIRFFKGQHPE